MSLRTLAVTRRQVLAALGVGAGAAAIASCSRSSSGDGRIRLAMFHAPESKLNPLTNDGSKLVRWSCAESLTGLTADGDAQEMLATAWKREDETTWRFTLREGVTFHDGTALSAENAAAALTFAAGAAKPPRVLDGINLTAKADGKDLLLTTAAPDPLMPQRVSSPQLAILSPAAYPSSADGAIDPVGHGTGAFILKQTNGSSGATLERNDKYWGKKAAAPGIDVTYVPDGAARGTALRTDTADIVEAVPVAQAGNLDKELLHEVSTPRTITLYLNTGSGAFADPALRAAARNAVDPSALIKTVFEGHADSPVGLLGPAVPWAAEMRAWKKETYPGATGAAATGKVPGVTAAGSVPAGTTITLASYTDRPELGEMVPLLARQLEAAGFSVTQDVREYNQIETEALAGKFDAVLVSRSTVLDSGDAVAYMTADFSSSGSYSMSQLSDPTVDAAISKASGSEPGEERRKAIMEAEQAILVTGAAIPIVHERVLQGEAAGVSGAERDPNERTLITSSTAVKK